MSVYSDGNLGAGRCKVELKAELAAIFERVKGRLIPMEISKGPHGCELYRFDFLGAIVHYPREARTLRVTMEEYIHKMASRFEVKVGTPVYSPSFDLGISCLA